MAFVAANLWHPIWMAQRLQAAPRQTLREAPIDVKGSWGSAPVEAVQTVISRMRGAFLKDVPLISDRQPTRLMVENRNDGHTPPSIWLHEDRTLTAWIVVDVGERDWSKLSYQFGHELGHVLCNSWARDGRPQAPSQWLEEVLVEAASIRGLRILAQQWRANPPFPGDAAFSTVLEKYAADLIQKYAKAADEAGATASPCEWLRAKRMVLDRNTGLNGAALDFVSRVLDVFEHDPQCVGELGALNRWPARSAVSLETYLQLWQKSCRETGVPGVLPRRLSEMTCVLQSGPL